MFRSHEPHDDLKARQRCTDVVPCILFLVALGFFALLYIKVLAQGNISRLYHGINYVGQVCGVDAPVRDEPYLYWCMKSRFASVPELNMDHPICVNHCPGAGTVAAGMGSQTTYEIEPDCAPVLGAEGMASYRTIIVFDRYCLPDPRSFPELARQVSNGQLQDAETFSAESMSSILSAWPVLLGSFFVAVTLGYLYLVLLRHCAEPLIWLTVLVCIVGFGMLGVYLFANAGTLSGDLGSGVPIPAAFADHEESVTRIAAASCLVISLTMVCLACCFKHSITVGSACVEVACDTIFEMPPLLLLPVLKAFFKGILALVLLAGFLALFSMSDVSVGSEGSAPHFVHNREQQLSMLFYMLMSFWILSFVNALYQFVVAYAVAEYYYTPYDHDLEKDVGCCAVWDGLYFGLVLHGGSLAFGSLLISSLMVVQKVLEYAQVKNKEAGDNKVIECLLCCCFCCIHCCKDVVEFVNKNAYIDMAITSNDFCAAAKNAMKMIIELGSAMAILNGATFVFTLFGTIVISLGSGAFTYLMVNQGTFADQKSEFDVADPMAPMVVSCMIGVLVALSFMHIFDMTSDTLLYCYGVDSSLGKAGHTAPAALKELVHGSRDSH